MAEAGQQVIASVLAQEGRVLGVCTLFPAPPAGPTRSSAPTCSAPCTAGGRLSRCHGSLFSYIVEPGFSGSQPVRTAFLVGTIIGPAAVARSFANRPGPAIALAVVIALVTVWITIVASDHTNWPLGFYVGVIAAGFFLAGSGWTAVRRAAARQVRPADQRQPRLVRASAREFRDASSRRVRGSG